MTLPIDPGWLDRVLAEDSPERVTVLDPADVDLDALPKCAECGYILYGLPERRCPECGTPFSSYDLRQPTYVRRQVDRRAWFERFFTGLGALLILVSVGPVMYASWSSPLGVACVLVPLIVTTLGSLVWVHHFGSSFAGTAMLLGVVWVLVAASAIALW